MGLSFDNLLNKTKMHEYLEKCKEAGTGSSGLITKCDRMVTGLSSFDCSVLTRQTPPAWPRSPMPLHESQPMCGSSVPRLAMDQCCCCSPAHRGRPDSDQNTATDDNP